MGNEVIALLGELEARIDRLKISYEQYFLGIDKLAPEKERQECARIVRRIQTAQTTNTALRFRLNSLNQRFLSYQSYWNRILREIEAGTYHRDLARVERDMKRRGINVEGLSKLRNKGELEAALMKGLAEEARSEAQAGPPPVPADAVTSAQLSAVSRASGGVTLDDIPPVGRAGGASPPPLPAGIPPPLPAAVRRAAPSPSNEAGAAPGGSDDRMRQLYKAYISAKERTGESTEGLSYDRLVRTLQKQVPAIQEKTGCTHVDFKIEIRQGKTILKAVPKR
ncbi:MAG: MXAN_5187 C-terminal domain-containing protein [bacterium]